MGGPDLRPPRALNTLLDMSRGAFSPSHDSRHRSRLLAAALLLSTAMHSGVGIVAGTMGLDALSRGSSSTRGVGPGGVMSDAAFAELDWEQPDRAKAEPTTPPEALPPATIQVVEITPPPPPPEPPPELRLGLAKSPNKTDNWLGDVTPTPHSGLPSSVDQPELALNPGAPGTPMARPGEAVATPPEVAPVVPEVFPAPADTQTAAKHTPTDHPQIPEGPQHDAPPTPIERPGKADHAQTGAPNGQAVTGADQTDREGSPTGDAAAQRDATPRRGQPTGQQMASAPDSLNVITPPSPADKLDALDQSGWDALFAAPSLGNAAGTLDGLASAQSPARVLEKHAQPEAKPMPQTAPRAVTGASQVVMATPSVQTPPIPLGVVGQTGEGGTAPGLASEKESDASAITPEPEVRPGMPWAGEGLEVFTRRIELSLFSRSTRFFRSPLLKVTFDRTGTVTAIDVLESSGSPDVDDSTRNSVYKWTARGKQLEELRPGATLAMNFRILLRGR